MPTKVTAPQIRSMKGKGEKIVCVTAYDYTSGSIVDEAGVDLVLVGDSLGNVILGYDSTLPVSLEVMVHHTRATRAGVQRAVLVSDLPFGSYGSSVAQAVDSSVALMKAGAEAVKLEGPYLDEIRAITKAGIPVMGHIGMTPQSVHNFGGFRIQGKGDASEAVLRAAKDIAEAGAFAIVIELTTASLATRITESVSCPTIGIGAGPGCDGQIQVFHDIMGLNRQIFRHARAFVPGRQLFEDGLRAYASEVREGRFPAVENSFE